jgi:hypothetical protein
MDPEYERDGREQEPIVPSAEVLVRVDTDGGDHQSPDKIAFGGEAHAPNVSPPGFIPRSQGGLLSKPSPGKRSKNLHTPLGLSPKGVARFVTFRPSS